MPDWTVEDLMDRMPGAFQPEKAQGVDAVIQFNFTGAEQSEWYATIKDGSCAVTEGVYDNPNITLTSEAQDYIAIVTGKMDAMQAFMQGKLKLKGDLNLAMKMPNFFKIG